MLLLPALMMLQGVPQATSPDSARRVADTVLIEPLGARVIIPSFWTGRSSGGSAESPARRDRLSCQNAPWGPLDGRVIVDQAQLANMGGKLFGSMRAAQGALDATVPRRSMVAHMGSARFDGQCLGPQVHLYVTDSLLHGPLVLGAVAQQLIARDYGPVQRTEADSAGWHLTRLSWTDDKTDFIHPGTLEVWTRKVRKRYIVLGIIYRFAGAIDTDELLSTLQVPIEPE